MKNKNIALTTIVTTSLIFYTSPSLAQNLSKLDKAGFKILDIVQRIGYWIILVQATREIISSIMSGANKNIGGVIVKYVLAYGSLFALPWLLDLVKGVF